ncbi:MAG: hypothetical protein Q9178_002141 [Gyalolechia marmorata]
MASDDCKGNLQSLLTQTAKVRIDCRAVCGREAHIVYQATNLYGVLRRLQQEASTARSSLSISNTTYNDDLVALYPECMVTLKETSDFLLAYKTLGHYEDKILGSWEFASFTERQKSVVNHFKSEIIRHTRDASRILVVASADSLGELRDQLDYGAGHSLSAILNDLTALLMANGDLRLSMLVKGLGNEQVLWGALHDELLGKALDEAFLDRHRKVILRYVRALERRSGFAVNLEASTNEGGVKMTETECKNSAKRRSLPDAGDDGRKRARTMEGQSANPQHHDPPDTNHSDTKSANTFFRFRDPRITFGPDVDDDLLADFLEEEDQPSQKNSLRDQIRDTYRLLCEDHEPRYEMMVFQGIGGNKDDEKQYAGLTYEIENRIVMKLDNLELGQDQSLRNLRKMIIIKVQKMLDDLDSIKTQSGNLK